jgi:hypothetical protein
LAVMAETMGGVLALGSAWEASPLPPRRHLGFSRGFWAGECPSSADWSFQHKLSVASVWGLNTLDSTVVGFFPQQVPVRADRKSQSNMLYWYAIKSRGRLRNVGANLR